MPLNENGLAVLVVGFEVAGLHAVKPPKSEDDEFPNDATPENGLAEVGAMLLAGN